MTNSNHFKQSAKVAVIAMSLSAGYTTLASAHSSQACFNSIREFCEAAHVFGTAAYQNCMQGAQACANHRHPGQTVPRPPEPNASAEPGRQFSKGRKFKKLRW